MNLIVISLLSFNTLHSYSWLVERNISFDSQLLCRRQATYIRLLHGKIGILEGFSALATSTGVGPI